MHFITEDGVDVAFYRKNDVDVKDNREIAGPEKVFIDIRIKGSTDCFSKALEREHEVRHYAERFPKAYEAFVEGEETSPEGTPIEELPGISVSLSNRYKMLGIRTIEELANASDAVLQNLGNEARPFQRAAKEKLELEELRAFKEMKEFVNEQKSARDRASGDGHDRSGEAEPANRGNSPRSAEDGGKRKPGRPRTRKA